MDQFYKDLKALRESRGIDLDDIHHRTKIGIDYLIAIENGHFSQLPHTYVRLFVRAYALEVGADPDETLNQLEATLGKKPKTDKPKQNSEKVLQKKPRLKVLETDDKSVPIVSAKNMRKDMIMGIILVAISIFAIYVIRLINAEEAAKAPVVYQSDFLEEGPITDQILQNEFDLLTQSTQMLEANGPFTLKLATAERLWYSTQSDSFNISEGVLPIGDNRIIEFSDSLRILFKHTKGLNLYLNGSTLNSLQSSLYPAKVSISSADNTLTIQHFTPIK